MNIFKMRNEKKEFGHLVKYYGYKNKVPREEVISIQRLTNKVLS